MLVIPLLLYHNTGEGFKDQPYTKDTPTRRKISYQCTTGVYYAKAQLRIYRWEYGVQGVEPKKATGNMTCCNSIGTIPVEK